MDLLLDINNINQELFDNIVLQTPAPLQGGTYLAKLTINDNPILFQTPKSKTKKGIVINNKRNYCDLLFEDSPNQLLTWINSLENTIMTKIYEKAEIWFNDKPSLDDIQYNWNTSLKIFKKHTILRTFLGKSKNINDVLSVYDSDQNRSSVHEITNDTTIISIIEVTGLKFSSSSFHLEYCLRQIMIIKDLPIFDKCIIKLSSNQNNKTEKYNSIDSVEEKEVTNIAENNVQSLTNDESINNVNKNKEQEEEQEQEQEQEEEQEKEEEKEKEEVQEEEVQEQEVQEQEEQKEQNVEIYNKNDKILQLDNSNNELNNDEKNKDEIIHNESNIKEKNKDYLEKTDNLTDLSELTLDIEEISPESEIVNLKKPNEVYLELYKRAKFKAKEAKLNAIKAYLELKNIKKTYMLDEIESSDEEILDEI